MSDNTSFDLSEFFSFDDYNFNDSFLDNSSEPIVQSIEVDPAPFCVDLEDNGIIHRYNAAEFEDMMRKIMHAAAEREVQAIMAQLTRSAPPSALTDPAMNAPISSAAAMITPMVIARSASSASGSQNTTPVGNVAQPANMPQNRSISELLSLPFVELTEEERNKVLAHAIQRKNAMPSPPNAMLKQVKQHINTLSNTDKEKTLTASPPVIDLTRVESGRVEKTKSARAPAAKKTPRTPAAKKGPAPKTGPNAKKVPCSSLASAEAVAASGAALQAARAAGLVPAPTPLYKPSVHNQSPAAAFNPSAHNQTPAAAFNPSVHIQSPAAARAQALAYAHVQAQALAHTQASSSKAQPTKTSKNNGYRVPSTPATAYFPPGSNMMAFGNGNREARAANMLEGSMSAEAAMQYGAGRQSEALQRAAALEAAGRRR
ncbi:hypothetical protein IQ07DRAFT_643059 [Pyrenochaeta sp. DS3sAY3a]|nr:hypothetical protein IQ07DRAFT_643059 [Pyrenochaeta sp. DS3sAY3a]